MRPPIEQPDAKRTFHVPDYFGYRRLRHRKMLRRLRHAAPMHDGQKNVKIAQFEPAPDTAVPMLLEVIHNDS